MYQLVNHPRYGMLSSTIPLFSLLFQLEQFPYDLNLTNSQPLFCTSCKSLYSFFDHPHCFIRSELQTYTYIPSAGQKTSVLNMKKSLMQCTQNKGMFQLTIYSYLQLNTNICVFPHLLIFHHLFGSFQV